VNIRQRYLNQMVDECLRLYPSEKDAFDRVSVTLITGGVYESIRIVKRCVQAG
jgi:cytochrome P450